MWHPTPRRGRRPRRPVSGCGNAGKGPGRRGRRPLQMHTAPCRGDQDGRPYGGHSKFVCGGMKTLFGNEHDWLHLEQLFDTPNNELIIVISTTKRVQASVNSVENVDDEKLHKILSKAMELIPDDSQTYKIHFKNYILYQGRNESYASNDDGEIRAGTGLILFEKSKLLEYLSEFIYVDLATHIYEGVKLRHYGVYTLNNITDIVTFCEPIIEKVNGTT